MDWHEIGDQQVTESIDGVSKALNHASAVRRMWGMLDDLLLEKHIVNIATAFGRDDCFSMIDVGCGTGSLLSRVALHFPKANLRGVDSNALSIATAKARGIRAEFSEGRFEEIDGNYDVVACCEVFEHVEQPGKLLDKLITLTKPGGLITFSTPSGWMWRAPRLANLVEAMKRWDEFKAIRLEPEKNWRAALPSHPAIFPRKIIRMFENRGGKVISRKSSLWTLYEFSRIYRAAQRLESQDPFKAVSRLHAWICALEAAMELLPLLRVFESRCVLAVRTPT
ncbi:MAG TPA: methyltransferase domain-containing protein [Alphaproteobacteria bacterium]|nr:methyltransferase domain-containing protein [Alphaproteobacteria bacterium]